MSDLAGEREALSRACVKAMRAKGLTFKSFADEIGVSPFIIAAALMGQMALPKEHRNQCPLSAISGHSRLTAGGAGFARNIDFAAATGHSWIQKRFVI